MAPPIILIAFANSQDAYLENIKRESALIIEALEVSEDRGFVRVYREESATTDEIINYFNRFNNQIEIFHFGGHADGKGLELEDGQGQGKGLANLLANQSQIKFVFLNGCSTRGQVDFLLKIGVKIVIATSVPIDDARATEFAKLFYLRLANQGTIAQSFTFAADSLSFKYGDIEKPKMFSLEKNRSIVLDKEESESTFPWGIYYKKINAHFLNWTLPSRRPDERLNRQHEPNEHLLYVLEAMSALDDNIEKAVVAMDVREGYDLIIKNFPWNIGSQISLLVSEKITGKLASERLEQIISVYLACIQWLYFVVLSQLWNEKSVKKIHNIDIDFKTQFNIQPENFLSFDYLKNFKIIISQLEKNDLEPFVSELTEINALLSDTSDFKLATIYLENIRQRISNPTKEKVEFDPFVYEEAELHLTEVLCALAFLVKYQMITVRDIKIYNPRHLNTKFQHKIGRLNAHSNRLLLIFKEPIIYDAFLDNDSVILMKDIKNAVDYLNLSPFIIDRNTYGKRANVEMDIYTYAYSTDNPFTGKKEYYYLKSSRNLLKAFNSQLDQIHTGIEFDSSIRKKGEKGKKVRPSRFTKKFQPYAILKDQFEYFNQILK